MSKEQLERQIIEYAKTGNANHIKQLLDNNPSLNLDVNAHDSEGYTALMWAVSNNETDTVKYLVNLGADVNARCELGTVLGIANENENEEMVKLLNQYISKTKDENKASQEPPEENIILGMENLAISEEKESLLIQKLLDSLKSTYKACDHMFTQAMARLNSKTLIEQREKNREQDKQLRGDQTGSIVWVKPSVVQDVLVDGEREQVVFTGKTPEKTVYLPFSKVHRYLYEAGKGLGGTNYLFGHVFFIVSDRKYSKDPIKGKYEGGRTYVDFPLILSKQDVAELAKQKTGQLKTYPISTSQAGTFVGGVGKLGSHSEHGLRAALTTNEVVSRITNDLTERLPQGHKVYEVVMFLNSSLNICNDKYRHGKNTANCETVLSNLQSSYGDGTFLKKLKINLENRNYVVVSSSMEESKEHHGEKQEAKPRCLFMVSANEEYTNGAANRTQRLKDQSHAAYSGEIQEATIDIKRLAGKVVPSVPIDSVKRQEDKEQASPRLFETIEVSKNPPKLTGFHSCNYKGTDDSADSTLAERATRHRKLEKYYFCGEQGKDPNWRELIADQVNSKSKSKE